MNEKLLRDTEKAIRGKMIAIRNGSLTKKDSGIGRLLNPLKALDEPLYEQLMEEYKKIVEPPKKALSMEEFILRVAEIKKTSKTPKADIRILANEQAPYISFGYCTNCNYDHPVVDGKCIICGEPIKKDSK